MLHHLSGDDVFGAAVRFAIEQILGGHFGGEGQRCQGVHDEVDP